MRDLAGPPQADVEIPDPVRRIGERGSILPVWRNQLGGLTFEVRGPLGRLFVKWAPAGSNLDLAAEAARLEWASNFVNVPHVVDRGWDEEGSWLSTSALPGTSAVADRWRTEPAPAVRAMGEGLRRLHEALPVSSCPFEWSAEKRLREARGLARAGDADPAGWHDEHRDLRIDDALGVLADVPAPDRLVVCHGDACAPNTLVSDDGRCTGHVDFEFLGRADRWADLAVATWSTRWNYGPGWESALLDAYGVDPDAERTAYYRLLWDLAP
jgi:kanamycin kinase